MKKYVYRIRWANKPPWMDYLVHAKDAQDARVMAEVWGNRWGNGSIQSMEFEGEVKS
jgi:hypothetical protein